VTISITNITSHPYTTKHSLSFARDFGKKTVLQALFNKRGTVVQLLSTSLLDIYPFDSKKISAYSTKSSKEENLVMAAHPTDNNIVAIASNNNIINVVNLSKKQSPFTLERHSKPVHCLAFSEKLLLSVSDEHKIIFWEHVEDPATPCHYKFKNDITFRGPVPIQATFDPGNTKYLLFVQHDCLSVYDLYAMEKSARYLDGISALQSVTGACYSRTGKYVYCVYGNGTVHVFDPQLRVVAILSVDGTPECITASTQKETEFFIATFGRIYSVSATDSPDSWTVSS